jgi:hypothetical protein
MAEYELPIVGLNALDENDDIFVYVAASQIEVKVQS